MKEAVRRADLYLRARYPHLKTRILKLSSGFYGIIINDFSGNINELENEFSHDLKPLGIPVKLFSIIPNDIEEELPIIKDSEIGKNFSGISLTLSDLKNLLIAKFQTIDIIHLEPFDMERKLNIYTDNILDENIKKIFIDFLYGLDIHMDFYIIEDKNIGLDKENKELEKNKETLSSIGNSNPELKAKLDSLDNPIMNSFPAKLNTRRIIYEEKDEQMWFDKIGDIYAGNFTKTDVLHSISTDNSCYIDYGAFSNVNIRNGIILYDRMFIEPPIDSDIKSFCSSQKIKTDEIIQLCKDNKLVFVLPQPSFRYDSDFFIELYGINPNCILSRRALSALIICDLVDLNNKYFINTLGIDDSIFEMAEITREINKEYGKTDFYNIFMWPQRALRSAFEVFLFGSTYRVAAFGINNIFTDLLSDEEKKNIELEFIVNSDKVHISSALNSQYFPRFEGIYSNQASTSIMGNMLNLYKNSSIEKIQDYVTERQKIITKTPILPVSLIEVDEYISVTDLNALSKSYFSSDNFASILGYLLSLSVEDMEKKIIEYNSLVEKKINRQKKVSSLIDFSVTAGTDAIGLFKPLIPFIGTGIKLFDGIIIRRGLIK